MSQAAFNIFDALSAWGKTLPSWQCCLLTKLVSVVELPDVALDEVNTEYLIDQKLVVPESPRATWDIVWPQFQGSAQAVASVMTAMSGVSGVNALAAGETLTFGPKLTVVYGAQWRRQVGLCAGA